MFPFLWRPCLLWLALTLPAIAQVPNPPVWHEPMAPFRIADDFYYVGTRGLASYLVTTPAGHVLINSSLESSVPFIRANVEKLGFKFTDIKILLISHAHWDHDAGSAAVKELTGAKYMVMEADVQVVETGGRADPFYGHLPITHYPPAKVDRVLHDGDEVKLGKQVLVAHWTPGHTQGCTTWSLKVTDGGKTYEAVIIGSPNVNDGYKLVNFAGYPTIAADYERTFRVLKSLPCDIFLGAHGDYFDMARKLSSLGEVTGNPFVDPEGYKQFVEAREQAFRKEYARQRKS